MNKVEPIEEFLLRETCNDLQKIQVDLVAPKNLYNDFAKFSYRNCESILQAVKPYLEELNCTLTITDKMVLVGDRIYVKAIATFTDSSGNKTKVSAFAREALARKGMDDSMLTGATSSYARKYALSGLFLLDDNQDSDSTLTVTPLEADSFSDLVEAGMGAQIYKMMLDDMDKYLAVSKAAVPKKGRVAWKENLKVIMNDAADLAENTAVHLSERLEQDDEHGVRETVKELNKHEKWMVWRQLKPEQQDHIQRLMA